MRYPLEVPPKERKTAIRIMEATRWPPTVPAGIPLKIGGLDDKLIDVYKDPSATNYLRLTLRSKSGHQYKVNLVVVPGFEQLLANVLQRLMSSKELLLSEVGSLEIR